MNSSPKVVFNNIDTEKYIFNVEEIVSHPNYMESNIGYDIALIRIAQNIEPVISGRFVPLSLCWENFNLSIHAPFICKFL